MENQKADRKADAVLFRDNPDATAAYLNDAFDKNDLQTVLLALNRVMLAQNVQAMAREGGLRRDSLYKTFGGNVEPLIGRVMALCNALGVRLMVRALPSQDRLKRPKLGRPRKNKSA